MLHLSPESGKWVSCSVGDDGKCELLYHAPVGEGEIAESLLWETYASEELYRKPSEILHTIRIWLNAEGLAHREYDLPAVEYPDGHKEWWIEGKRHRINGLAIVRENGDKEWYKNGERHRTDGPAVELPDGRKEWWVNGKLVKPGSAVQ